MWNWNILNTSYSNSLQGSVQELTPDAGSNYKRVKYTTVDEFVSGEILLNATEYRNFLDFYTRDTKQGELTFSYYDCRIGANRTARFVGKPVTSRASNHFRVKIALRLKFFDGEQLLDFAFNDDLAYFNTDQAQVLTRRYG